VIHPSSDVQSKKIGRNTKVWQFVVILSNAQIGKDCNINSHVFIENDVVIGNGVTIKSGVQLWDGIRIHDKVFVGPNVTFTNDLVPRSKQYPEKFQQTTVEQGASIGANSTIIGGITIGKYSLIGAGSIVTKNIPPFSVWYGVPASQKGYITRSGELLDLSLRSKASKLKYQIVNQEPVPIND
jgi:UDP-2-acetamido-3-amino-2,3-dideoxy-glucuronate N-acetyltransferase